VRALALALCSLRLCVVTSSTCESCLTPTHCFVYTRRPRDEDVALLGALILSFLPPEGLRVFELVVACIAIVSTVTVVGMLHKSIFEKMVSLLQQESTDGSMRSLSEIELHIIAVSNGTLISPSSTESASMAQKLTGLNVLYVLATLLILLDARHAELATLAVDSEGASAGLSLLFVLFGFESFVKQVHIRKQSAIGYASMHVAQMAPAVMLASLVGFALAPKLYTRGGGSRRFLGSISCCRSDSLLGFRRCVSTTPTASFGSQVCGCICHSVSYVLKRT